MAKSIVVLHTTGRANANRANARLVAGGVRAGLAIVSLASAGLVVSRARPARTEAPRPVAPSLVRSDSRVASDPGVTLFVREVRHRGLGAGGEPIVLVHGARVPGLGSFDLPVPGGSLAGDLALGGHRVFIVDVRGFGGSTRPAALDEPAAGHAPAVRSDEAVRDLHAVVDWVRARTGAARVALFGWATGGHWAGMYAALHPDRVGHLVVLNTLYGANAPHALLGHGSDSEDPKQPGRLNPAIGAYTLASAASLVGAWDRSIPVADKSEWRDPAVVAAYVAAALASDPTSATRTPPSLRAPAGPFEDSVYLAMGRQLWDASLVRAPTLILRSERDFWSRAADVELMRAHLVHAARVRAVTLAGATHHVHLDRAAHGRARLLAEVLAFVGDRPPPSER